MATNGMKYLVEGIQEIGLLLMTQIGKLPLAQLLEQAFIL